MEVLAGQTKRHRYIVPWILSTVLVCSVTASAQSIDEYRLKAAFLYSFLKFVEWPQSDSSSPFSICILGDDPFGPSIDILVKDKTVSGRKVEIRRLKEPGDAKRCHIVFMRSGQKSKATQLIEAVNGLPVLTVGEQSEFGKMGGLVYLTTVNETVRININVPMIAGTGLKVDARLLSLATNTKNP